ncbi:MAG: hypothetical protein AB1393_06480 [Candidatus Edwardsbacteria bacterium]
MNAVAIPKSAARILTEITGESRFEVALWIALRDILVHKLEEIETSIRHFEEKYKMSFHEFKALCEKEEFPNQYSFEVESEFLEWEALCSRKSKIEEFQKCLP